MDTQVTSAKNFASGELAINVEAQSQNRTTSQMIRGEISTGVYSSWKGASKESLSIPKTIRLPATRISVTQIAVEREVFEDEENEVESDNQVVHNTNAFNQISQDGDPSGNYMHQNPKI